MIFMLFIQNQLEMDARLCFPLSIDAANLFGEIIPHIFRLSTRSVLNNRSRPCRAWGTARGWWRAG